MCALASQGVFRESLGSKAGRIRFDFDWLRVVGPEAWREDAAARVQCEGRKLDPPACLTFDATTNCLFWRNQFAVVGMVPRSRAAAPAFAFHCPITRWPEALDLLSEADATRMAPLGRQDLPLHLRPAPTLRWKDGESKAGNNKGKRVRGWVTPERLTRELCKVVDLHRYIKDEGF